MAYGEAVVRSANLHDGCRLVLLYPLCQILLGPLLKAGDILIFDEFRDVRNEFRAFADWQDCIETKVECVGSVRRCDKIAFIVK